MYCVSTHADNYLNAYWLYCSVTVTVLSLSRHYIFCGLQLLWHQCFARLWLISTVAIILSYISSVVSFNCFVIIIVLIVIHKIILIVASSTAQSHMWEFTLGHLSESRSAPGGRQVVGQAANLTFEFACRPNIHPSPCIIAQPWGWYSFTVPRRVEGWVDLDTAVSV